MWEKLRDIDWVDVIVTVIASSIIVPIIILMWWAMYNLIVKGWTCPCG